MDLRQLLRVTALAAASVALITNAASAEDWPGFRGPGSQAPAVATQLPTAWDANTNIVWKTALPGPGASSPATFGDKIFLTCYSGYGVDSDDPGNMDDLKRHLVCLDRATGEILWDSPQPSTAPQKEYRGFPALHGYASGTPVVDEDGIYVFYGTTGAAAYDHSGKQLWLTNCGTGTHGFGTGTSPAVHDGLVFINASVESDALIALDKRNGREVWKQTGIPMSWSTPVLVTTAAGATEVVVSAKENVLAFDPATGQELWKCKAIGDYICPTPLVNGDVLYVIGGRKNTALAIRAGGRGDVTETHKLWEVGEGSNVSSPVYFDGHLYFTNESRAAAYCLNAATGETVYKERLEPKSGKLYASPIVAGGKLYYVSREDGTYVLAAKPAYEVLQHNQIEDDDSIFDASPVPSGDHLLLRSDKFLYCIGQ
jgi:outer membrane protein assembly factor BamB